MSEVGGESGGLLLWVAGAMAELVPGQSAAPVGIKSEGFADALHHRVRQVRPAVSGRGAGRSSA